MDSPAKGQSITPTHDVILTSHGYLYYKQGKYGLFGGLKGGDLGKGWDLAIHTATRPTWAPSAPMRVIYSTHTC